MVCDKVIVGTVFVLSLTLAAGRGQCCVKTPAPQCGETGQPDPIEHILKELRQTAEKLESYQANVEHLFKQPAFDSQTLRKGILYYARFGRESRLRINFQTLAQDDEKEQKYVEHYVFDGISLSQIDYQLEACKRIELVDPNVLKDTNEPVDAFDLVSRNFPIVGFSRTEDLKKEFEIELIEQKEGESDKLTQLHLEVKPDSVYRDDYTSMDFWIDRKSGLPAKMVAVSTEEDVLEIRLLKPRVNKKIDRKVFDLEVPERFDIQVVPLKKTEKRAGGPKKGEAD
ncbi:MAG: LolA family protein [Planctomycetota bacterium]|jgi:hypothetical protein